MKEISEVFASSSAALNKARVLNLIVKLYLKVFFNLGDVELRFGPHT